jgi:LysM repeat protein
MMIGLLLAVHMYTVKPGDTLSGIVGNRWQTVCEENRLADCNLIYPGQKLSISGGRLTAYVTSTGDGDSDSDDSPARVSSGLSDHVSSPAGSLGCSGLESLWDSAGGNPGAAFIAAEIAMAESGGQQFATGPNGEEGYWQINPVNGSLATYNAYGNARAAIILSGNGANWSPWTTYTSGAYIGRCLWMLQYGCP